MTSTLGDELVVPVGFFRGPRRHRGAARRGQGLGTPANASGGCSAAAASPPPKSSSNSNSSNSNSNSFAFSGQQQQQQPKQRDAPSFDAKLRWPPEVGDPDNPRNSHFPRIASFFLGLNRRALAADFGPNRCRVSFGHWIPDEAFCEGLPHELHATRVAPPQHYAQIKRLAPHAHVFGGINQKTQVDCVVDGTRFVRVEAFLFLFLSLFCVHCAGTCRRRRSINCFLVASFFVGRCLSSLLLRPCDAELTVLLCLLLTYLLIYCLIVVTLFMHHQNALPTDATSAQLASASSCRCTATTTDWLGRRAALGTVLATPWARRPCRSGDGGGSSGSQITSSSSSSSYFRSVVGSDAMNWEDSWLAENNNDNGNDNDNDNNGRGHDWVLLESVHRANQPRQPMNVTDQRRRHTVANTTKTATAALSHNQCQRADVLEDGYSSPKRLEDAAEAEAEAAQQQRTLRRLLRRFEFAEPQRQQ